MRQNFFSFPSHVQLLNLLLIFWSENQFLAIFLMTYRTFISPCDLIKKLVQRYKKFSKTDDAKRKKLAEDAYSFLLVVVNDLDLWYVLSLTDKI